MKRALAYWWLRRFRFCFPCDRRTLLEHHHHNVHPDLHPARFTRGWRPSR